MISFDFFQYEYSPHIKSLVMSAQRNTIILSTQKLHTDFLFHFVTHCRISVAPNIPTWQVTSQLMTIPLQSWYLSEEKQLIH